MKKLLQLILLLFVSGCTYKNPFLFTSDYRKFPIAVDCEKASDVHLTFSKSGMITKVIDEKNVEFRNILDDKKKFRPICIFEDMTLEEFCQYKGPDEVAPYFVPSYQKINAVKCKEILKNL